MIIFLGESTIEPRQITIQFPWKITIKSVVNPINSNKITIFLGEFFAKSTSLGWTSPRGPGILALHDLHSEHSVQRWRGPLGDPRFNHQKGALGLQKDGEYHWKSWNIREEIHFRQRKLRGSVVFFVIWMGYSSEKSNSWGFFTRVHFVLPSQQQTQPSETTAPEKGRATVVLGV